MAIEFTKQPTEVIFSGNPVTVGIKDTAALTGNVEGRCVLLVRFLQGFASTATININYNSKVYTYQFSRDLPFKMAQETLAEWVARIVIRLNAISDLEELFYIRSGAPSQIIFMEKEVLSNITVTGSIYAQNFTSYITSSTIKSNRKISKNGFHAIGIQIRELLDFSMSVPGTTLSDFAVDYGSALEVISSVNFTSISFLEKISDGSLSVEENMSSLLKFKKRGHFNIIDTYTVYNVAKLFCVYAYKLTGTPPVKFPGVESSVFRVIEAEITRTRQAELNESLKTIWDHLRQTNSFMTWAPNNKVVDVYFPEILNFLVQDNYTDIKYWVKEYYDDGSDHTYSLITFNALKYQVVMLSAALLKIKSSSHKKRLKYEVWLEYDEEPISEIRTYILSYKYEPYARYWPLKNGFGVYEILRTTGKAETSEKINKTFIDISTPDNYTTRDRDKEQTSSSRSPKMKVSTGPLNEVWAKYYLELFDSEDAYLLQKGKAIPATIIADEFVYKTDGENISPHTFEAELTGIDEERVDTTIILPIEGEYLKGDFDESFLIGN